MATNNLLRLTKQCEGCRLVAYPDPATGGAPWTIGYGQTGPDIHEGLVWTQRQADDALESTLNTVQGAIKGTIKYKISQNQLDALTDLAYNIGVHNFATSTLLQYVNQGKLGSAAAQFAVWNRANGKVMPGLVKRRSLERDLFVT